MSSLFKKLRTFTKGIISKGEKATKLNPIYWDGVLKEHEEKAKTVEDKYYNILGELSAKKEIRKRLLNDIEYWKTASKRAYTKFEQTDDAKFKAFSKEAYSKITILNEKIKIQDKAIEILESLEKKIGKLKAQNEIAISKARLVVENNKNKIALANLFKDSNYNLESLNNIKLDNLNDLDVDVDYYSELERYKSNSTNEILEELEEENLDKDFENFIKNGE